MQKTFIRGYADAIDDEIIQRPMTNISMRFMPSKSREKTMAITGGREKTNGFCRTNWESTLVARYCSGMSGSTGCAHKLTRLWRALPQEGQSAGARTDPASLCRRAQTVFNALNDLRQTSVRWDCGFEGLGILVSDSLMPARRPRPERSAPEPRLWTRPASVEARNARRPRCDREHHIARFPSRTSPCSS